MPPKFVDLGDLEENKRIEMIGHRAMAHNEKVAFIVEDDAKATRYMAKLKAKFPLIKELWRGPGPVEGTVTVKVCRVQN